MVDNEEQVVSHCDGLAVECVLDTLDQLNDPAYCQHRGLAHRLAQPQVKSEEGLHHVTHTVGQE